MLKASLKSLWARKVSLFLSTIAIVLGTAFVGGSFTFTDMLDSAVRGIVSGAYADVNVQPKGAGDTGGPPSSVAAALTQADVDKVAAIDGVQAAYGTVSAGDAYVLDADGKPLASGAPGIGGNYVDAPSAGGGEGLVLKSGHAPQNPDEVVIDPGSFTKLGLSLGGKAKIYTSGPAGTVEKTVVGTALYGSQGSAAGATYALFTTPEAQRLFVPDGTGYQGIWVVAKPGVDVGAVTRAVGAVTPKGFEAKPGAELAEKANQQLSQMTGFLNVFLLVFAGIALLVGGFLIVNTFTILVAQRARELALFRAMGASRAQVTRSVLVEALLLGLVGSTLGLAVGFGLAWLISKLFGGIGLDLSGAPMHLTPTAVVAVYGVGLVVTLVAALVPAVRAGRVPPVAAMSGDFATGESGLGWRAVLGSLLTALGATALLWGLFGDPGVNRMIPIGSGALLCVLGVAAVSPLLGRPVIWLVGRVDKALFGATGRLAEVNAVRNPRRTAITASALMISLALVTALGVMAASMKASMRASVAENMRSDFVVQATSRPFAPGLREQMSKVPGVAHVYGRQGARATIEGERRMLSAMAPDAFDHLEAQTLRRGSLGDFRDGTVLVRENYAKEKGWEIGRTVPATLQGGELPLKLVATYSVGKDDKSTSPGFMTTTGTLEKAGLAPLDFFLAIDMAPGADKAAVQKGLDELVKPLPLVTVADQQAYVDQAAAQVDVLLYLLYALLGLAVVIAVFGIVNTLGLSIVERTREIGLLRAVGLTKGQVRLMVLLESVTIAILGAALGIGLGLLFGFALQRALADQGLTALALPWGQIAISAVAALVVGVFAGLWPAIRATNLDVLKAIATA